MKTIRTVVAVFAVALMTGVAQADDMLTILHTNDFHSRLDPIKENGATCSVAQDEAGECWGGAARLATLVNDRRAKGENVILLDAGDQFQGTLYYTLHKGQAAAEIMNALQYDAMALGNHEFDDGPEVLGAFADTARFPVLLANADYSNEPHLRDVLKPSTILQAGNLQVGVIGVAPADTGEQPSAGPNITFFDPISAIENEVKNLRSQGVNKIIVISHSGYALDQEIAQKVAGIDVIVGGNSNTVLSNVIENSDGPYPTMVDAPDGGKTAIVQAGSFGKYLGELTVTFDEDGTLLSANGDLIPTKPDVVKDTEMDALVAQLAAPLEPFRNSVVTTLAGHLDGTRETCRAQECSMGNLLADATLHFLDNTDATVAIQSGGGLRASLDPGDVTHSDILTVLPFQNTLATLQLTGAEIIAALENGVSRVEENAGRFPQIAGMRFTWDPAAAPNTGRIQSVDVLENGQFLPIDKDKTYRVATNRYMMSGGDGYSVFAEKGIDIKDEGISLDLVVSGYLQNMAEYEPVLDGRIVEQGHGTLD